MRKIFVVLLVLAIAGGALAQEEAKEGSNWTLTGEGRIGTTVDFWNGDYDGKAGISGGSGDGDTFIDMFLEYKKGDWTISFPFHIATAEDGRGWFFSTNDDNEDDDDAFSGIQYNPDGGPLTLEVGFDLTFGEKGNAATNSNDAWYMVGSVGAAAIYDGGNYWFKVAVDNINKATIAPGAIGGWYDFGENGSRLAVSYKDATDSEWWRASDLVLNASILGSYAWENIGGDYSDYGLAYKFHISPDFNFGFSFAGNRKDPNGNYGQAGESMFTGGGIDLVDDFLTNFIVGMKYEGVIGASLMAGMWNWGGTGETADDITIPLHFGLSWSNDLPISAKADISALFGKKDINDPLFNLGAQLQYGDSDATDGFWARLLAKGIDLGDNYGDKGFSTELWLAYQRNVNDDNGGWEKFDGKGTGLWAYAYAGFLDFTAEKDYFPIDFAVGVGYEGLAIGEQFVFGVGAEFWMSIIGEYFNYAFFTNDYDTYKSAGLKVNPVITWNLIKNGSIEFSYEIGTDQLHNFDNFTDAQLNINRFSTTFKYSF